MTIAAFGAVFVGLLSTPPGKLHKRGPLARGTFIGPPPTRNCKSVHRGSRRGSLLFSCRPGIFYPSSNPGRQTRNVVGHPQLVALVREPRKGFQARVQIRVRHPPLERLLRVAKNESTKSCSLFRCGQPMGHRHHGCRRARGTYSTRPVQHKTQAGRAMPWKLCLFAEPTNVVTAKHR